MTHRTVLTMLAIVLFAVLAFETTEVWARAGGGGSRGSRSYSAPARPAPQSPGLPSNPSRTFNQPAPAPQPRSGLFGGLMGGLAGFALGGLLGGMLFGGLGHGFGIGLMDLLLIGGGIFILMAFLRRRRADSPQPAYATAGGPSGAYPSGTYGTEAGTGPVPYGRGATTMEPPAAPTDLERGLEHIRQMDPRFDPDAVAIMARNAFVEVQQGMAARNVRGLRDRVAPEMYAVLQAQCDRLQGARQSNRLEQIQITRADISEAWQENGRDYMTICISASMLDYIVDDATGGLVEGSRSVPQHVEEFWSFVRPVGAHSWQLSAIQTG
jgi:predicted lipid-binding transport protein (Tim44 family)